MPEHNRRNAPLPTSGCLSAVSKEEARRIYYQTSYQHDVPGRMPSEEDRGENFIDVHSIGRRTNKYMDFQLSTAPLLNRNATQSEARGV
mmetsp:Transcript_64067/g.144605  ORF Transcript_64067/g.144605 Transcript_64067/m.144605 type:complete len:89 (-) Transcript_64067:9-275(-)